MFQGREQSACLATLALTPVSLLQFLTNIFFIPFMALRAAPAQPTSRQWPSPLPAASRAAGAIAAAVGVFSIYWALVARPGACFAKAADAVLQTGSSVPSTGTRVVSAQSTVAWLSAGNLLSQQQDQAA